MIESTGATVPALIAFIAFNMLTIPCFAAVATAKAELNSKKNFINTIIFWITTSYVTSTMIYLVGSWWWTIFIFLALAAVAITLIVLYNKGKLPKIKINLSKFIKKRQKTSCGCSCSNCAYKSGCNKENK